MKTPPDSTAKVTAANRQAWDASAPYHRAGDAWARLVTDLRQPGFSCLDATLTKALQNLPVAGKSVAQVGCNNGREVLSLASLGAANVLGIDQSKAFLDQARELAAHAKSSAVFLCADIYALPDDTPRNFDVALITIGVLYWMPDLPRFFTILAGLLKPGGVLLIYETHPFLEMMDPGKADPARLVYSYFRTEPFVETDPIVYEGAPAAEISPSYWFLHRVGDILNAAIAAGLRIESFTEFPHSNREDLYDKYENQPAQLPMCFTLTARKT